MVGESPVHPKWVNVTEALDDLTYWKSIHYNLNEYIKRTNVSLDVDRSYQKLIEIRKKKKRAKKINVFQNPYLRRLMKIKWQDKVSKRELLERSNMERLSEDVRRRRWRFIGHILRQRLCYSPDMDPWGKEKERSAKNNLAAHSGNGPEQGGSPGECVPQRKTQINGEQVWKPCASLWHKGTGNR